MIEAAFSACRLTPMEISRGPAYWRTLSDDLPEWSAIPLVEEALDPS